MNPFAFLKSEWQEESGTLRAHIHTRCPYTEKTERRGMDERLLIGGDDVQACSASSPADGAPVLGVSSSGDASVSSAADGTPPSPLRA